MARRLRTQILLLRGLFMFVASLGCLLAVVEDYAYLHDRSWFTLQQAVLCVDGEDWHDPSPAAVSSSAYPACTIEAVVNGPWSPHEAVVLFALVLAVVSVTMRRLKQLPDASELDRPWRDARIEPDGSLHFADAASRSMRAPVSMAPGAALVVLGEAPATAPYRPEEPSLLAIRPGTREDLQRDVQTLRHRWVYALLLLVHGVAPIAWAAMIPLHIRPMWMLPTHHIPYR